MKKSKTSLFEWVGDVILLLIMLIVILPLLWLFVSSIQKRCGCHQMAAAFLPCGLGRGSVPLCSKSNSGTEDAAKYSDLCGQRDRHQSVL